jgi:sulfofructosephosphate aldolase
VSRPRADARGLGALARTSGVLAMLALDQRESLRAMLREAGRDDGDDAIARFKVDAARTLTRFASAVLLDTQFGLGPVRRAHAIAPGCALIVAADELVQQRGEPVEDTNVDEAVLADERVAVVADAYKLLVIWRPDGGAEHRRRVVSRFVEACRDRGKPAIVEGIVRAPRGDAPYTPNRHASAVVAAARELAVHRPDLYKAEVPTLGRGGDHAVTQGARLLTTTLDCPWVVLSNGTSSERFPSAVLAACRGGASGFLAGRAIWAPSLAAPDVTADLTTVAAARLRELGAAIDNVARPWFDAAPAAHPAGGVAHRARPGRF